MNAGVASDGRDSGSSFTYAGAGVDTAAGDRAVELMRGAVAKAVRPESAGGLGGFAGLFRLDTTRYDDPLLASATDGVGTKALIAQAMDVHDTIGIDLVAMIADDLVVCGAEPLFLTDYIACGKLLPERVAAIVGGVAEGCRQAGCALTGGETAEHPDILEAGEYDLAGAGTGIVEADHVLGPHRVRPGDVVLGLPSSGLHANGYSLARRVLLHHAGFSLADTPDELGGTGIGETLLTPTRIYTPHCLALARGVEVHSFAHVTGGGLAANLSRVLPAEADGVLNRGAWTPHPVFDLIAGHGGVERAEMERTFNMGMGMLVVTPAAVADRARRELQEGGVVARPIGEITPGSGAVRLEGDYAS